MKSVFLKKIITLFIVGFVLSPFMTRADNSILANSEANDEHVVWIKTPINFEVPVSKQRLLSFPDRVEVENNDPNLTSDKVTIYNNAGTLYVTAHRSFEPILLQVKLLSNSEVVLVYLSASKNATDNNSLDVVVPSVSPSPYNAGDVKEQPTLTINAISLLRFAEQQFSYQRIAEHPNNIVRTPMYTHQTINVYYGDAVQSFPLVSWRGGDLYVTAVQLKNITSHSINLDPTAVIGNWQAASFYRFDTMQSLTEAVIPFNQLTPMGTQRDFTLLFLVSDRPFGESLNELNPYVRTGA